VLVLIPEISLTPQAVARYRGAFGNQVAVLHSGLSPGERLDSWKALRDGSCRIALGPRSAVFAPLRNLGLIVVDEEHESSYKQNDPAPRYHARDAAVMRGKILTCTVLLGSATPSLESYHNALSGKYRLCRLPERMDGVPMPTVALADPRESRKDHPVFTPMLEEEIRKRLDRKEQAILLLNRRGYANFLQCGACGAIETCPHCAISLTFHLKQRSLRCHYCGFTKPASDLCPACGGSRIRYRGLGTERVEEELRSRFPDARLLRMDMDTTRRKGAHARIVEDFGKHKSDILLGTQMVAKGHDFPGVTLVGIVSADTGLYFPDFRSGERTFQLLTQAAGRAGRKDVPGEVVIQTATPDHPAILFAQKHDYETFYQWAAEQRREFQYPPFGRLVLVGFRCPDAKKTFDAAAQFFEWTPMHGVERLGPVPAPLSLIQGQHRFHILYRQSKDLDPSGKALRDRIRNAIRRFRESDRFRNVRIHADVDPMDLM
ncbi:MAG TPA: primosomal protein N', partial [bacterium]